ncbi:MAG: DUF4012 domain-containing protein [Chloroflexi bacterium]|nr:DUF4012 domain-containing protein [Chloroflexota bacterium]
MAALVESLRASGLQAVSGPEEYAAFVGRVRALEEDVRTLRRRLGVVRALGWLPGVGPSLQEGLQLLEVADSFARGGRLTLEGYASIARALAPGAAPGTGAAVTRELEEARSVFTEAQEAFRQAREARSRLQPPYRLGATQRSLVLLDQYAPLVEFAGFVALETPQVVGEVLELRNAVTAVRHLLNEPSAFLDSPMELKDLLASVSARAQATQTGLLQVQAALQKSQAPPAGAREVVDTALQMSVLATDLSVALSRLAEVADRVFQVGVLSSEGAQMMGQELPAIRGMMQAAQHELAQLNASLTSAPGDERGSLPLAALAGALGVPVAPLQREESLLETGGMAVEFLSWFLGYDGPKTYLLVGQNDDEIRATGGFIGVVAELKLDRGQQGGLRYLDGTAVDNPPYTSNPLPPEPIYRYLWMGRLLFRDGNWNPHFPTAAADLADLYERFQAVELDGVVAVTEELVFDLVEAFGGIRVPELPDLLDRRLAERYVEGELLYPCQPRHVSGPSKRCFDEDLFRTVLDRLTGPLESQERRRVVQVFLRRLASKDVLIHVFDPQAAELLWQQGWNGALRQVDYDYLLVVDSSLPGHARAVVERRLQYQITLATDSPLEARLLVEYRHTGREPDPDCRQTLSTKGGCYWNYLRVYIPVLATDVQAPPIPLHEGSEWLVWGYDPADSLTVISSPRGGLAGFTEVAGYLVVEPQTSVTLPLAYQLPASVVRSLGGGVYEYRLLVQKQPGTPVEPVSVLVRLPPGAELVSTSLAPTARTREWVRLDFSLAQDTTVVVSFRRG